MPSRRIASSAKLSPIQDHALDPFSSFDSNNINKLTRIISNGKDGITEGLDVQLRDTHKDSIRHIDIFSTGEEYNEEQFKNAWDTPNCKIVLTVNEPQRFQGFNINDITDIECRTITYKIPSTFSGIDEYIGQNVNCVFTFEFDLKQGAPREILASINNDNNCVYYPRNYYTDKVQIKVFHNFKDDIPDSDLELKLSFICDPFDTYNEYANCDKELHKEYYNGQSQIKIRKIKYTLDILSYECKDFYQYYTDGRILSDYPSTQVHPSHKLYVTPGVAIKDDVMLDEKGMDKYNLKPIVELDVSKKESWVKGNPYTLDDFNDNNGGKQFAYVYNKYPVNVVLEGSINTKNKNLEFLHNDHVIKLCDDLEVPENYVELPFTLAERSKEANNLEVKRLTINFERLSLESNELKDLYGQRVYCVSKNTGKVIFQFEHPSFDGDTFIYDACTKSFDYDELKIYNLAQINNVKFILPIGPVKVSGKYTRVNQKMVRWANVVLYYSYFKNPVPNTSYIGLIRDEDFKDPCYQEDYIVLGEVRFISPTTIDVISYGNRQQFGKNKLNARDIDYGKHISIEENDEWVDPEGHKCTPTSVSNALSILMRNIRLYANKINTNLDTYLIHQSNTPNEYDNCVDETEVDSYILPFIQKEKTSDASKVVKKATVNIDGQEYDITVSRVQDLFNKVQQNQANIQNIDDRVVQNTNNIENLKPRVAQNEKDISNLKQRVETNENHIEDLYEIKMDVVEGNAGQVLMSDGGKNKHYDWIMNNGVAYTTENDYVYVCNTEKDLDECKSKFKDDVWENLYSTFMKIGYTANAGWGGRDWTATRGYRIPFQYGIDNDYPKCAKDANGKPISRSATYGADAWFYDPDLKSMIQPCNTYDFTGFVTKQTYQNYDIKIRCYQPKNDITYDGVLYQADGSDNDLMSFIAAFTTDENGYQHIISFDRYGGDTGYWKCCLDRDNFNGNEFNSMKVLGVNEDIIKTELAHTWRSCGDGAIIRVIRDGNKFTAWTSYRIVNGIAGVSKVTKDGIEYTCCQELESSKFILDLDNFTIQIADKTPTPITDDPKVIETLTLFKNKKVSWGYASCSECLATFRALKFPGSHRKIIDLVNNKVWLHDYDEVGWREINETVYDAFGKGKFSYNSITNKLFWNKENEIIEILDRVYNKTHGLEGQVFYADGNDNDDFHTILDSYSDTDSSNKYLIVTNEDQLNACKESAVNYVDIFNKWQRFGHYSQYQYGLTNWEVKTSQGNATNESLHKDGVTADGNYNYYLATRHWFYNDKERYLETNEYNTNKVPLTARTVVMPVNAVEWTGFVSDKQYSDYDICMRFYSPDGDDDFNSIVAAFVTDSNGIEHTISFVRTPNTSNYFNGSSIPQQRITSHWDCILNHRGTWEWEKSPSRLITIDGTSNRIQEARLISNEQTFKDEVSSAILDANHELKQYCTGWMNRSGWSACGGNNGGTLIRVVRKGNVFKATTTKFIQNATLDQIQEFNLDYEIVLDLDNYTISTYETRNDSTKARYQKVVNISPYKNELDLFKTKASFGFSSMSQPVSQIQIRKFITFDKIILDFYNNKTTMYDGNDWVDIDSNPLQYVKAGTLYYNTLLKSKYWVDKDKNISCVDGLFSEDGSDYKLNVSKINDSGKIAVWDVKQKRIETSTLSIEDLNRRFNSIITLPDYSNKKEYKQNNTEFTISAADFPRGGWLNFQFNSNTMSSSAYKTIDIKGSKDTSYHTICKHRNNASSLDHAPVGNCGMIPIGVGDKFKLKNLVFDSSATSDVVIVYGMI